MVAGKNHTGQGGLRILVTGGAGFIGSHLVDRLLALGHSVICLDNLLTGQRGSLAHLARHPRFEFRLHDVTEPVQLDVDQIYNLACPASPIHYQYNPVQTVRTAVLGAINMLDLAKNTGARIFQASTSEIYGDPLVHPQPEGYWGNVNPIGPRACYDEGKRCAETLFFDYRRQFGLSIRVARLFNTYGPRMHREDGRVVSDFIVRALAGEPLVIHGDGRQTRSFCYVDDTVEAILRLMQVPDDDIGPVNLGNPAEETILGLAERVLRQTGSRSTIRHEPRREDDPIQRQPDIALARARLDWQPETDLETGLARTIAYFKVA
ncbi:UDP-glucuronic acid decarboxylase family protein [Ferrovibrio sp.]|uniref:UDP-glucuronic acid decarboxylase family protein n=1 Tax=Ferrovibrio sp. TaxID=1917215 RepID=UPI001B5D11B8|nr:UDP-glucuronic acid decarboxylase family protein [Ferrovibrio sp.]MBP7064862.1 SDR family oxidoreductase [Ferrovibrio sp.]